MRGVAVATAPNGDAVVAGNTVDGSLESLGGRVLLQRYTRGGRLRPAFGRRGTSRVAFSQGPATIQDMAILPDGRIVLVGSIGGNGARDVLVIRVTARGRLDRSFNTTGVATVELGSVSDRATTVAVQPDGALLIAGSSFTTLPVRRYETMFVARLRAEGTLDPAFGTRGITPVPGPQADGSPYGAYMNATGSAVLPDGRIVVAGNTGDSGRDVNLPTVVVLDPNGVLDTTVDGDGVAYPGTAIRRVSPPDLSNTSISDLVVDRRRSRLYLAGHTYDARNGDFLLMALNRDLGLDTTFGRGGVASVDIARGTRDYAGAAVLDRAGSVVIAGTAADATSGPSWK